MKILGIDYGTKRIGIALSDEGLSFAFPKEVIPSNANALPTITDIARGADVKIIVVGESLDLGGRENVVMEKIREFAQKLEKEGFEIVFEQEYLSSHEAERFQGKTEHTDASAAAIILQRYLDKQRTK